MALSESEQKELERQLRKDAKIEYERRLRTYTLVYGMDTLEAKEKAAWHQS